jgi:Outer membrane protein beta-barrel domain
MQQSEFEKQVHQKMEELKLSPADAVWQKVAAGLPAEKKPRRWVFIVLLFAGLLTGSALLWNKFNANDKEVAENNVAAKDNILQNNTAENKEEEKAFTDELTANEKNKNSSKIKSGINKKNTITAAVKIKTTQAGGVASDNTFNTDAMAGNQKYLKTKAALKIKIKAPVSSDDDVQEFIAAPIDKNITANGKTIIKVNAPVAVSNNLIEEAKKSAGDSSVVIDKDVVVVIDNDSIKAITATKSEKKKNHSQWQYGIVLAAGTSNVKSRLFGNNPVFADAVAFNTSGLPVSVPISTKPNAPSVGPVFNVGFYAQKNITARWKFSAGINYSYQSNIIKVGKRVDSVINFYSGSLYNRVDAAGYYAGGSTINYKNKFNLLEIPLFFEWKLSKKSPVYLEGGPTVMYLINSNALIYSNGSASYFTDAAIFNKLLLSFNAGAGINLAQNKKLPFSIGYQFKYSAGSVIKTDFGKQHFVNSLVYIKIPFKK